MNDTCWKCGKRRDIGIPHSWTCQDCGTTQRVPQNAIQRECERILANVADLPVGKTITLADIAHDGFGGMTIKRHSKNTLVFQRTGYNGRSRWADELAQAYEEIEQYVSTGTLKEPSKNSWF